MFIFKKILNSKKNKKLLIKILLKKNVRYLLIFNKKKKNLFKMNLSIIYKIKFIKLYDFKKP
jgi:hypothetical protein